MYERRTEVTDVTEQFAGRVFKDGATHRVQASDGTIMLMM